MEIIWWRKKEEKGQIISLVPVSSTSASPTVPRRPDRRSNACTHRSHDSERLSDSLVTRQLSCEQRAQWVALRAPVALLRDGVARLRRAAKVPISEGFPRIVHAAVRQAGRLAVDAPPPRPVPQRLRVLVFYRLAVGDARGREHARGRSLASRPEQPSHRGPVLLDSRHLTGVRALAEVLVVAGALDLQDVCQLPAVVQVLHDEEAAADEWQHVLREDALLRCAQRGVVSDARLVGAGAASKGLANSH